MMNVIERLATDLFQASVQSACIGLALIAVSWAARRGAAPWRSTLLAIGLVRFALPSLPSPLQVKLPWMPAMLDIVPPAIGSGLGLVASLAIAIWLTGAMVQLVRLLRARMRLSRLVARAACDKIPRALIEDAQDAARALGVPMPRVCMSTEVEAPLVAGLRHPTVIVDPGWTALDARARRLVLLHEMAHVKRGDLFWVELASWLSVAWWWHPVFRMLVVRMRSAQEDACDDLAMLVAPDPDRYCRVLLAAAERAATPAPALALEPLGFDGRTLERRIRRLMDPHTRHAEQVTPAQWVATALFVTVALAAFGSHAAHHGSPAPRHLHFSIPQHSHHHDHGH